MSVKGQLSAEEFAAQAHGDQRYGTHLPYHHHLASVVATLHRFGHDDPELVDAAWLHDTIEDTSVTSEDIAERFGVRVAELVWAVTNEDGANRGERHQKTYPKIAAQGTDAITLKLADRIANTEAARDQRRSLLGMYVKEHPAFRTALRPAGGDPVMWDHLDALIAAQPSTA